MSIRAILSPLVFIALAGCVDTPTPSGETSHQLVFTTASHVGEGHLGPYSEPAQPDSLGVSVRIDFDASGPEVLALVSPPFSPAREYVGTVSGSQIMFVPRTSSAALTRASGLGFTSRVQIDVLRLDASVSGGEVSFRNSGSFETSETRGAGDTGSFSEVTGDLVGTADTVPPSTELSVAARAGLPLLPWEPIEVSISEPVEASELRRMMDIGDTISVESDMLPWGLVQAATVTPSGWWPAGDVRLSLVAGLSDPNGNLDTVGADLSRARVRELLPSAGGIDFERSDSYEVWGSRTTSPVGCASGSGCEAFTLDTAADDNVFVAGVFARLEGTAPARRLRARVRVLGEAGSTRLVVRMRASAVGSSDVAVATQTIELGASGDSGWEDVTVDLPGAPTGLGLAVDFRTDWLPPSTFFSRGTVVLDDITIE